VTAAMAAAMSAGVFGTKLLVADDLLTPFRPDRGPCAGMGAGMDGGMTTCAGTMTP